MGKLQNIITSLHTKTERDYFERMRNEKVACAEIARKFDKNFWDGDRKYGYGGYKYDGRWAILAEKLIELYNLQDGASILDVGCGKGFVLYEFKKLLPNATVKGFDISQYAVENAKEEVRDDLFVHLAQEPYPFKDKEFDLVISLNTLHNLYINDLKFALREVERVGKSKYIVVESYRNVKELFNVQCWALTCESFFTPDEWIWLFDEFGYQGDYEFIYFE
jgi:SAM-dependent methyltransferase